MKNIVITITSLFTVIAAAAQSPVQTIRGQVIDKISQAPIPGALVQIPSLSGISPSTTDENGAFVLNNVPVGKQSIKATYLGYREALLQNLSVNSGKELVLTIGLEEDLKELGEVEVKAEANKNKSLNEMSTVSTRAFSVEETRKFAAAANDPARMAIAFAGVVAGMDGNNHISIRGNSPNGLVWRMEGVEIPNPNHFSNVGTSGGGISILSSQLLNNSDFSTGAFAAEYGNALSGIFDLRLRRGNNRKREYTVQAGVLGVDFAAEGPFIKGYDGSYLINYRYSTLSILGKMGVPIGDAITNFQDLSFNFYLPTANAGYFTVFGFGGLSYQTTTAKKDSLLWKEDEFNRYDSRFYANTGATGITHTKLFRNQSYLKTAVAFSGTQNGYYEDRMESNYQDFIRQYAQRFDQTKVTVSSTYTKKLSAASSIRSGIIVNRLGYNLSKADRSDTTVLVEKLKADGQTETIQGFFQWSHKVTPRLTTNVGMHYLKLLMNNTGSAEPRAGVRYEVSKKDIATLGYGLHSQVQPIGIYFPATVGGNETASPNRDLALSKAHHIVLGYDRIITEYAHVKTELYYQHLFDIPISNDKSSTYSIINEVDGFSTMPMVNDGLGKNYGAEFTLERFLHRNMYCLVSASLYESKYRAANNQWYNTRFNTNFALSVTAGKEWQFDSNGKNRVLGFNLKSIYVGGFRYTPIDLNASIAAGQTQFNTSETFAYQNPAYYRLDIGISLKRNFRHVTSTVSLDIQNTTNRKNVGGQYFDQNTGEIKYWYQLPLLPLLSYRLEF